MGLNSWSLTDGVVCKKLGTSGTWIVGRHRATLCGSVGCVINYSLVLVPAQISVLWLTCKLQQAPAAMEQLPPHGFAGMMDSSLPNPQGKMNHFHPVNCLVSGVVSQQWELEQLQIISPGSGALTGRNPTTWLTGLGSWFMAGVRKGLAQQAEQHFHAVSRAHWAILEGMLKSSSWPELGWVRSKYVGFQRTVGNWTGSYAALWQRIQLYAIPVLGNWKEKN